MVLAVPQAPVRVHPDQIDPPLRALLAAIAAETPGSYLVGGALRDLLRGRQPNDIDVIVPGDAAAAARRLAAALGGHAFPMDEARDQQRITLDAHELVSTIDVSPIDGDVEADLRSRDFTINALAAAIEAGGALGDVIDPTGGLQDLEQRRLRLVDEANLRADPLRLLRAARLSVELELTIEDQSAATVRRLAPLLARAAGERQREELCRILATPRAAAGVRLLDELGLLSVLLPELDPARGVEQPGRHHYWDVFDHSVETLAVLDSLLAPEPLDEERPAWLRRVFDEVMADYPLREYLAARPGGQTRLVLLKLAGLLHDVAKPETKTVEEDGRIRFFGHPELGARKAAAICRRLRLGNADTRFVSLLVEEHLRPTQLSSGAPPSRRAIYRFFRDLGDAAPACLVLMLADGAAAAGPRLTLERWIIHAGYARYVLDRHEELSRVRTAGPRLITGDDLIGELGLQPGPLIGRLMEALDESIGAGEITSREQALEYARERLEEIAAEERPG